MTGTASEIYDNNTANKLHRIELFSAWLFGKINAKCLLIDISDDGCAILVPKKLEAIHGYFNLIIMSPDHADRVHTILSVEPRWLDKTYSRKYNKVGIKFKHINNDLKLDLELLKPYLVSNTKKIKCSLLPA